MNSPKSWKTIRSASNTSSKFVAVPPDERVWYTDLVSGGSLLCSARLPDPVVDRKVEQLFAQAKEVLGPGSQISLNTRVPAVPGMPDYAQRVERLLTQQLAEGQVTVAPGQSMVLDVSAVQSATGESHTFECRHTGKNPQPPTQVAGQKVECRVAITSGGRVFWERQNTFHNGTFVLIVHLKPGQTLDQYLTDHMWSTMLIYLEHLGVPSRLFDVTGTDGFGESRLNAAGPEVRPF